MIEGKDIREEEEKGATLVEYALLVALIAIIAIAALRFLGNTVSQEFSTIGSSLARGGTGGVAS